MYKFPQRILSRLLLLSFLFETFSHQTPWSYTKPSNDTSQEAPSTSPQPPLLAKQPGLTQEQAGQRVLPHALYADKLSNYSARLELLPTYLEVSPDYGNATFEARGGEKVRFQCELGQWRAQVSSRIGAFSRESDLPVVCSLGEDVASSIEALRRYPRWHSQRRIHVLGRNMCPTLGEVVYVGELGLKGGGEGYKGESSGIGAPQRATSSMAETATANKGKPPALAHQVSLRLQQRMGEGDITSTQALVEAFNSTQDEQAKDALARWVQGYIDWFNDQLVHEIAREDILQEYRHLSHLKPTTRGQEKLLRDYFSSLSSKALQAHEYYEQPSMEALGYILRNLSEEVFRSDPDPLTHLARQLLAKLTARNNTFTQATYPTNGPRLDGLYQALVLIQAINPASWNSMQEEGPYQQFKSRLEAIKEAAESYYPIRHHAKILLQRLRDLERNPGQALSQDYFRSTRKFVADLFHFYKGVYTAAELKVHMKPLQEAYETLRSALQNARVYREAWYEWYEFLQASCKLALQDSGHYPAFMTECQELVAEPLPSGSNGRALCYGFVLQLRQLALNAPTAAVRQDSIAQLEDLARREPWSSDRDLMWVILDSLASVHLQGGSEAEQNKARAVLESLTAGVSTSSTGQSATLMNCCVVLLPWWQKLVSYTKQSSLDAIPHSSLPDAIVQWLSGKSLVGKLISLQESLSTSASYSGIQSYSLFEAVQQKLQEDIAKLPMAPMSAPEVRVLLQEYYQEQEHFFEVPSFFPEEPKTPMEEIQCHLMFLEQIKVKGNPQEGKANQIAASHERLQQVKTPIALEDLFKKRSIRPDESEKEIYKVLLVGEAGVGKTTLSRKLAHDWALGKWGEDFTMVYLIAIKNLQQGKYNGATPQTEPTLATTIVRECFPAKCWGTHKAFERLRTQVIEELEKSTTLVILDGLDERAGASEKLLRQAQDQKARHKLLMLSRPYGIIAERQMVDIEIEHQGFDDAQMDAYVKNYFQQRGEPESISTELLTFIKEHPTTVSIFHIPVSLEILCAFWRNAPKGVREVTRQGSLPGLYRKLTGYLWERYQVNNPSARSASQEELFTQLGTIALNSLEQGDLQISDEQVRNKLAKSDISEAMLQESGLLQASGIAHYQFPHLTFQEYFAGRTLAGQLLSEDENVQERVSKLLSEHKYERHYRRTLSFMAGEVSSAEGVEGIRTLLRCMEEDKEIVGVQHLLLQLRVLYEWLCMADKEEVTKNWTSLEAEFLMISSLQAWLSKGVDLVGKESEVEQRAGKQLLAILAPDMLRTGAVLAHAKSILTPWRDALKNRNWSVRVAAADALASLKEADPTSLKFLLEAMKDEDSGVRAAAASVLASLEEVDPRSLKFLLEATKDEDSGVRAAAASVLASLEEVDPRSLKFLLEATKDEDSGVRAAAASVLASLEEVDPRSLKLLLDTTKDEDYFVRYAAVRALGKLKEVDPASLKFLLGATKDKDWSISTAATRALAKLKAVDPTSLRLLQEATKDRRDWRVRQAAAEALTSLKAVDPRSLKLLLEAIKDEDWRVRVAAARALRNLKAIDPTNLKLLQEATKDKYNSDVRKVAAEALASLEAVDPTSLKLCA